MSTQTGKRVEVYDTTMRDGTQGLGFSLSLKDKIEVLKELDRMGVDYIEGGYPLSNPKDAGFFEEAKSVRLNRSKLCAFGMTRRKGYAPADDVGMRALVAAETPVITLVGKTWDFHVREVLRVSLDENVAMIADSIGYLAGIGKEVIYDAEHFFDGYKENPEYALKTIGAAFEAGAHMVVLCDTNGGTLPIELGEIVNTMVTTFSGSRFGIHPHNDSGCAIANALEAVRQGAEQVQGTINGVGERCGNVDLVPVIANVAIKMKRPVMDGESSVRQLTSVSRFVDKIAGRDNVRHQPFVGVAAFAHKGGMHVHAIQRNVTTYEHVPPETVGNTRRILVSELSGVSNIQDRVGEFLGDQQITRDQQRDILAQVTKLEKDGYVFEEAEASFELLVRDMLGIHKPHFRLGHYQCSVFCSEGGAPITTGLISVRVRNESLRGTWEGEDPLSALEGALRRALADEFPLLEGVRLHDRHIQAIERPGDRATPVRVVTEFTDGQREWSTVAIGQNVIDAGVRCICEGFEHFLLHANDDASGLMADRSAKGTPA